MLYLNTSMHEWCFNEMPPVINAANEEAVFYWLKKLYADNEWAHKIMEEGKRWYKEYHSNNVIAVKLLQSYKMVLSGKR